MGIFTRKAKAPEAQLIASEPPEALGAVTAGGQTYRVASYSDSTRLEQMRQVWQRQAYDIYDTEGHLYYATNYVGGTMSRIKLIAAIKPPKAGGLDQPTPIPDGPIADAIADISAPHGGQSGLIRNLSKNLFLTGEAWLIGSTAVQDGKITSGWDAVSMEELTTSSNGQSWLRRRLPGAQPESLPEGALTIRIWKEHPRYSELADSGVRSCIELLEKVIILNRAEKAVARSQLAGSGILALPQELVPPAWQNQGSIANPMEANPLWQALAESMTAPLKDESSPSAVVPLLLVGPGEIIKNIKYEPLNRQFNTQGAAESITTAIDQIANSLELPKEILLGTGTVTHWTQSSVRADVYQAHIQPMIELICEALTKTFLKQALNKLSPQELKAAGITNIDDIIVWYDASDLVKPPDKSDKALGLHDRFVITDDALAKEIGFDSDQILDKESPEYKRRVGLKLADPGMAITGTPTPAPTPAGPGGGGGRPLA